MPENYDYWYKKAELMRSRCKWSEDNAKTKPEAGPPWWHTLHYITFSHLAMHLFIAIYWLEKQMVCKGKPETIPDTMFL